MLLGLTGRGHCTAGPALPSLPNSKTVKQYDCAGVLPAGSQVCAGSACCPVLLRQEQKQSERALPLRSRRRGQGALPCTAQLEARFCEPPADVCGMADRGTGGQASGFGVRKLVKEPNSHPLGNLLTLMQLSHAGCSGNTSQWSLSAPMGMCRWLELSVSDRLCAERAVPEHHSPDGLSELPALIVPHVTWRGADEAAHAVLLHVLAHVDAHHGVLQGHWQRGLLRQGTADTSSDWQGVCRGRVGVHLL